jgi:hypothetical protein
MTGSSQGQNCSSPSTPPVVCTIWSASAVPGTVDGGDPSSGEYGVKFRADVDGSVTGVRFYKSLANTGTHIINLWATNGNLLASAVVSGESASGWQQFNFAAPVNIAAGTTYIASYFTPSGHYSFDASYFNSAVDAAPLHALANSSSVNGVYAYGSGSAFPASTYSASNYWADVLFIPNSTAPPSVTSTVPVNGANFVSLGVTVKATFNDSMDSSTINNSTLFLVDGSNNNVPGTVTYNSSTSTASLKPTAQLQALTTYTATVKGTVADMFGNTMRSDYSWSFKTGTAPPKSGPGGPILVITSAANPFSTYYGEILLAEGVNYFSGQDISTVTPTVLSAYDAAILGDMALTNAQVSMLSNWVNSGGNLITMHPDKQLAGLLGLGGTTGTMSDAYLLVNTNAGPGVGIVNQTIQYHGLADLYTLNGATKLATLYSHSTTPTAYPAVTLVSVGSGQAAAFTYDLARSVVYTRQGNPAWSGEQRDGYIDPAINGTVIRPDDLFFGNASFDPEPDWVDLNKVAIPQADEQQRFLVNLISQMNLAKKPLPRFWYLPSGFKAAVIMTGDDHNTGGSRPRFDTYVSESPINCSVADWQCVRATTYIWPLTPFSSYQLYTAQGFEIATHSDNAPSCTDFTPAALDAAITSQLAALAQNYPDNPPSRTNRTHCVLWSDYDSEPQILLNHGMRLDTTYYYWPDFWMQDVPGLLTGSGMPMRYSDRNGNIIDVYQATTQIPDEDNWTYPAVINTLLNNAVGPLGFYAVVTANMHTDFPTSPGSDAIVAAAQALGVPVVSSLQMLTWLDGRNSSAFGSLSWNSSILSFNVSVGTGARNLQAMVPVNSSAGSLASISTNGSPVNYTTQTIKGVQYAFFAATSGSYQATYAGTSGSFSISGTISGAGGSGATVTLSGAANATTTADASGNYSFLNLANGNYTVTPTNSGFTFSPASQNVTVNGANVTGVNFSSAAASFSSSGTISGAGGSGATVTLSGAANATTTADASGNYSFLNLANGNYTVTPSNIGFTFNPASQNVTVNGANVTGVNFSSAAATPAVQLAPTSLSFGNQRVGAASAAQTVTLTNTGTGVLTISGISFGGTNPTDFTQTNNCGTSVAPSANCAINVVFTPGANGSRSAKLLVADNAAGSPQSVALSGTGISPIVTLSTTSIYFGIVLDFSTSSAKSVTMRNSGNTTLQITSISIGGTNAADFRISSNGCGTTLAAGSTCTVSVGFTPQAAGARTATLNFVDDAANSPQSVSLRGTGTMVKVSPTSLTFVSRTVGTTSGAKNVGITNVGPGTLTISGITITGTNSGDFSQTNNCGATLAVNGGCTIAVRFTPSAIGTRTATLRVDDSDPTSPELVSLKGTGQ